MSKEYSTAHNQGHGEPWLITYADMVTLLMALFIVLLSVSTVDQQKAEEMVEAVKEGAGAEGKTKGKMTFQEIKAKVEKEIQSQNMQDQVEAKLTPRGIDINFSSQLFFDAGKAELKPEAQKVLDAAARILKEIKVDDAKIAIEGHTDSRPIKTAQFPSNWELSTARATRVLRYFLDKGVSEKKVEALGLAATRPKVDKDGKEISAEDPANRRVVIRVVRDPYAGFDKKAKQASAATPGKPAAGGHH
ncbi:MAG: OmpA family protein [Candidatus Sericytochromatia bacterium]|nr:OmpA family protein [Candidatus Tanganyikabacteria bacterium]